MESAARSTDKTTRAERLLSLMLLLADGKLHSAPALSRRFATSVRTLYRDLELLSLWGIPIQAASGREGGYRVMPGYTLDRSILTERELAAVSAALQGVGDATGSAEAESARTKITALLGRVPRHRRSWVRIELAPGDAARRLMDVLRSSIEEHRVVFFQYVDAEGRDSERRVEPAAVVYLWSSWYLYAYCRLRAGWRLFKLARMRGVRGTMECFIPRPEPSETAWRDTWEGSETVPVTLEVDPGSAAKAEEWFGLQACSPAPGGGCTVRTRLPLNEWLYGYLLSFGPALAVVEPEELVVQIADHARRISDRYK